MAAAVRLESVCYRYPGSGWVLQDVELDLDAGEYAVGADVQGDLHPVVHDQHGILERLHTLQHFDGKPSESGIIGGLVTQLDHSRPGIEKRPAKCDAVGKAVYPGRGSKKDLYSITHG